MHPSLPVPRAAAARDALTRGEDPMPDAVVKRTFAPLPPVPWGRHFRWRRPATRTRAWCRECSGPAAAIGAFRPCFMAGHPPAWAPRRALPEITALECAGDLAAPPRRPGTDGG